MVSDRPVLRYLAVGKRLLGQPSVEEGRVALLLVRRDIRAEDRYEAGQLLPPGEYLIAPSETMQLTVTFGALRTADEELVTLTVDVEALAGQSELDARLLHTEILGDRTEASSSVLERLLAGYADGAMRCFFRDVSLPAVAAGEGEVQDGVRRILAERLGHCGLSHVVVKGLRFGGDVVRRYRGEVKRVEAEKRTRELEARAALEVGEQVADRRRTEELRARTARLEQELRELKELDQALRETGLEAQVFTLRDEKVKAELYELLLERELSPEQIRARTPGRTREDVEAELRSLKDRVKSLLAEKRRVALVAACGEELFAWDVSVGSRPLEKGRWSTGFGPARTVAFVPHEEKGIIACGTPRGIILLDPESGVQRRRFELPQQTTHGVNGVAVWGDVLWATHQEAGVLRWPLAGGEHEVLSNRPARGVTFDGDGTAWVGIQGGVLRVSPGGEEELLSIPGEVTDVESAGPCVAVGTAGGTVHLYESGRDAAVLCAGGRPVIALAVADHDGNPWVLLSRKESRVECRGLRGDDRPAFIAPQPVTWIAATETIVAGSVKGGRVVAWSWTEPHAVQIDLSVPGDVRAVALWEES